LTNLMPPASLALAVSIVALLRIIGMR
jgi:hypothetical protein